MSARSTNRTEIARSALLALAVVALLATAAVARYLVALALAPTEASAAFALVRASNPLVFVAVVVAWTPLCAVLAAHEGERTGFTGRDWFRALLPGPFGGEPARLLSRRRGGRRVVLAVVLSIVAAYGWPLGLVVSHLAHPLAVVVGAAWGSLAAVAVLLRSMLSSIA